LSAAHRANVFLCILVILLLFFLVFLNHARDRWAGLGFFDNRARSGACSWAVGWGCCRLWRLTRCRGSATGRGRVLQSGIIDEIIHLRVFFFLFLFDCIHFIAVYVWDDTLRVWTPATSLAMRHVSARSSIAVLQKAAHDEVGAWIAHVILPAVHWVAKPLELAFFIVAHSCFEVVGVLLWHLVHVTEACEAVVPWDLARLVKRQAALYTPAILELPCAYRTSVDAVLLVADDVKWRAEWVRRRVEKTLEESSRSWVGVLAVFLDGICVVLLPLFVFFECFASREELGSSDEDGRHVADL
jgi:hypothetical protein